MTRKRFFCSWAQNVGVRIIFFKCALKLGDFVGEERKFPSSPATAKITKVGLQLHFGWAHVHPGNRLTGIRLWAQICAHLNFELRDCLITFPIFVLSQRLIARNVRELFSFNRCVSHLNEVCRIDNVSRGSLSCYEILTNN
jgi:hypothetical protein